MDLSTIEQTAQAGEALSESQDSAQVASDFVPTLTKTAFDAVPSLADAIRARIKVDGSSASSPETENASAETGQLAVDASQDGSSGQTTTENTDASTDGTTDQKTETSSEPAEPPKKKSRAERRRERAEKLAAAQAAGTAPSPDDDEDDDDFLVGEVERLVKPMADRLNELASTVTSIKNPGPTPPDVAQLNAAYVERFGDDTVFNELSRVKVENSRALTLEEDEQLATWANNRIARDLQTQKIQRDVSAVALGVANQRGVDAEAITNAPSLAAAFEAFWNAGVQSGQATATSQTETSAKEEIKAALAKQQELTQQITSLTQANEQLKNTNQQISDELETLRQRAPAMARQPISGGLASLSGVGGPHALDPSRQTGKQMLVAAAQNLARQRTGGGPALRNR